MTGRPATETIIPGRAALSVGNPGTPAPPGWTWASLYDVSVLGTGHTPTRNNAKYWNGDIPWIGIRDAAKCHGGVITDTAQHVTSDGLANSAARLLSAGTVCLSRTASVGYVVQMGREMATSQDFVTWTCNEGLNPRFLMYALLAEGDDIRRFGKGSTHTTIYFPEVKAFHICLPPVAEQLRIVAKLDSLFERTRCAREELSHIPRLIEHYKQAILAAAFRGELTADWRGTKELVNWQGMSLPELLAESLANGKSVPDGGGFPVLRLTALKRQILDLSQRKQGNWSRAQAARYIVHSGDFFVSRGNGSLDLVARGSYIESVDEEVAFPDTMIRIRPNHGIVNTRFLYHQWSDIGVRSQIVTKAKTTAGIYKVSQSDLNSLRLVVPPLEEQGEIVRRIEKALAWLNIVDAEQGQAGHLLGHLDQAYLAKAFRGELVPQDPNDEPASVLLDRIRAERAAQPKTKRVNRSKGATKQEVLA